MICFTHFIAEYFMYALQVCASFGRIYFILFYACRCLNAVLLLLFAVVQVQWYHGSRLVRPSSKYQMQLLRDGECVLRVRQATREDVGRYSCCASNVVGREICSADVYVEGAELVDSTSYISEEAMNKINSVARSVMRNILLLARCSDNTVYAVYAVAPCPSFCLSVCLSQAGI